MGRLAAPSLRSRRALSDANAGQVVGESMSNASSNTEGLSTEDGGLVEFRKEEANALLNEKIKGKTKFDFKGKCEMMTEYIRKLRACVKWYLEQEELHDAEREKHAKTLNELNQKLEELTCTIDELRKNYTELSDKFLKEEAAKLASVESYQKEVQARILVEKSLASASEELEKAHEEVKNANEQINKLRCDHQRLQEYNSSLQQYNRNLSNDAVNASATITRLQNEKATIMETLSGIRAHLASVQNQLAASKDSMKEAIDARNLGKEEVARMSAELQQMREDRDMERAKVKILTAEVERYKECTGKSTAELEHLTTRTNCLEEGYESQKERIRMLEQQLKIAREEKQVDEMSEASVSDLKQECEDRKKAMRELENVLAEKELLIFEGELVRKKLHNALLELKGNVRVFCRVRPVLPDDEYGGGEATAIFYPSSAELLGRGIELVQNPGQKHSFSFDKVFNHDASQEEVFTEISQLVQSALDGYKVCIFAYGQTGSGKTYTMMGGTEAPEQKGLIPRSLEQIFQTSQALSSQGWTFKMEASMLEIYNETVRDLLSPSRASSYETSRQENPCVGKQYTIKHDANGNTTVSDLTIVEVGSLMEVSSLFHRAAQSRSVSRTQMNEQSSRSHCVFTLRISGFNASTEEQVNGVLNLIDLAGSERLSKSGSTGERLKETQAINKSLSCLGDVILAISNKDNHVPFRNSKLTYLLQPCLGGDSKTLMFVNISPVPSSANESLCSLRFAAKVNACVIGVPRRQTHPRPSDARLSCS
ncbi:Kinesin-5 [Nymphaea thermarum]|nr:Kinesin-5 [Nymphaea thermarum]